MKKRLSFQIITVLLLLSGLGFKVFETGNVEAINRAGWSWSDEEVVSFESGIPSIAPEVSIDTSDNLHVVWVNLALPAMG